MKILGLTTGEAYYRMSDKDEEKIIYNYFWRIIWLTPPA